MTDIMTWDLFIWFGIAAAVFSSAGAVAALCANDHWSASSIRYRQRRGWAISMSVLALLVLAAFRHVMDRTGKASIEDDGGDAPVVFFLCPAFRTLYICCVAL